MLTPTPEFLYIILVLYVAYADLYCHIYLHNSDMKEKP